MLLEIGFHEISSMKTLQGESVNINVFIDLHQNYWIMCLSRAGIWRLFLVFPSLAIIKSFLTKNTYQKHKYIQDRHSVLLYLTNREPDQIVTLGNTIFRQRISLFGYMIKCFSWWFAPLGKRNSNWKIFKNNLDPPRGVMKCFTPITGAC